VSTAGENRYVALHKLGDVGRELERVRRPDPYPRATGPAPSLEELRRRSDEITHLAERHGARSVRVFGSVARGEGGRDSDLDVLVDMGKRQSLFAQAALQGDLEELLGCPVHVVTTSALSHARKHTREQIENEAISL
jgi:predicted nucleotidyltransferase